MAKETKEDLKLDLQIAIDDRRNNLTVGLTTIFGVTSLLIAMVSIAPFVWSKTVILVVAVVWILIGARFLINHFEEDKKKITQIRNKLKKF